jgi:hypothetical protein
MNSLFYLLALLFAITQAAPVTPPGRPTLTKTSGALAVKKAQRPDIPRTNGVIFGHKSGPTETLAPPRRIAAIHPGAGGGTPTRPPQAVPLSRADSVNSVMAVNGDDAATPKTSNKKIPSPHFASIAKVKFRPKRKWSPETNEEKVKVEPEKRAKHDLSEKPNERREHWKKFVPEVNRVTETDEEIEEFRERRREARRVKKAKKAEKETRKVEVAE